MDNQPAFIAADKWFAYASNIIMNIFSFYGKPFSEEKKNGGGRNRLNIMWNEYGIY